MTTPTLREAATRMLAALDKLADGCTEPVFKDWCNGNGDECEADMHGAWDALRSALAQPVADAPAEPLKGWKLNHARRAEEGVAEIGFLDDEDDRFSPIVTVDTGLYYQPEQALPLAVAILGMLQDAGAAPVAQQATDEQAAFEAWCPYRGSPDPRVVWAAAWKAATTAHPQQPAREPLPTRFVLFTLRDLKAERERLDGFLAFGNEVERAAETDQWIAALEAYAAAHGIVPAPTTDTTQSNPQR